ncbi:helix-hairpin-helix domain-containing protein [Oerskovia douganii]|uniref:helix-hairpin-helix domain-containing protein n=1 Tax=Oerskovia douganii TaxID=2762210 RepID=UPI002AB18642|nr:helix-hairpin-helix domain-containing protein [Oerskovia douganii]
MTFSRTLPPTADDDRPGPGDRQGAWPVDTGGDRLRRLRTVASPPAPSPDPGGQHGAVPPEGETVTRWPGAEGVASRRGDVPGHPDADPRAPRPGPGWGHDGEAEPPEDPQVARGPLHAVAEAYTAANGHPTSHAGFEHVPDGGPRRWSVGARSAVVAAVAVLLLAVGVGAWALADGDDLRPVAVLGEAGARPVATPGGGTPPGGADPDAPPTDVPGAGHEGAPGAGPGDGDAASVVSDVVVHVVGAVAAPGLVTVPEGSRVADALTAAGDATPDADLAGVNLAREVVDGEQIVVPRPGEVVAAAPGPASGGNEASTGPVDLNAADEAALDALSGIGPVLAARIVEWREANGPFTTVEELGEVSGIGDALLARLRDQVRV